MDMVTILICDDEPDVRVWLRLRLTGFGYNVLEATDGAECIAKATTQEFGLIVLDIRLPDMDGFTVCSRLRAHSATRHVPVVILTAHHTSLDDRVRGLRLGADDYLPKDVDPAELQARLETVIRRAQIGIDVNSLTRLPGNAVVTDEINHRLDQRVPFAVAWIDLDNFKAFNDRYGFSRGDEMINETAKALRESLNVHGTEDDFLGHVGGDDFVIVADVDRVETIAAEIIEIVDDWFPKLYDDDDRERGYIRSVDRQGNLQTFPIATVSVAVVISQVQRFSNVLEVAEAAGEVKKLAKARQGSEVVVDRRVH
jgi:PleD family two-component response regulator